MPYILSFCLLAAHPGAAIGATYYVGPSGSDANPGSLAAPWQTVQKAANTVTAGDTVYVQAGTYDERATITASGTAGSPILFAAQGTAELDGFVLDGNYLQIRGFTIKVISCAVAGQGNAYGINVKGTSSNFLIENNRIIQLIDAGLYTSPSTSSGIIRNNYFEENAQTDLDIHGSNHLIESNEVNGAILKHPTCSSRNDDANAMTVFGTGHIFRYNYIHDLRYGTYTGKAHIDCFQTFGGWQTGDPARNTHILIERNYCDALTYQTADEAGSGFTIEDTSSTDGTYANGFIIRNNLIFAPGCSGGQENTSWLSFVNNTCITTPEWGADPKLPGMDYWPGPSYDNHHYWIQNNIFYNFAQPVYINSQLVNSSTMTHGFNLAYHPTQTPNSTAFACGQDGDLCADPLFIFETPDYVSGDYQVQSTSPAIDAGTSLTSVTEDYDGNPRPENGTWDIGTYETATGPRAPKAHFVAAPREGFASLPVAFTNTSSGVPTSWSWDFGDGGTSTVQHPSHVYSQAGTYAVSLTVTNGLGQDTVTKADHIVVLSSCATTPVATCDTATKSVLVLRNRTTDAKDRWIWRFVGGTAATTQSDFADPTATTRYRLCLYDGSGLRAQVSIAPSSTLWLPARSFGYKYKNRSGTDFGVFRVLLKSGAAGKTKIKVKAKGIDLPDPLDSAVMGGPVTVQLVNERTDACWEATYAAALRSDTIVYKARIRR